MVISHHKYSQIHCGETSAQHAGRKFTASFIIQGSKLIHVGTILVLFVLLTPSAAFSYTVLWDTSHGVYRSDTFGGDGYQPSQDGYYQKLAEHLGNNDFTVDITSDGFLTDDPAGYDVIVVCLMSAFYSSYTSTEVDRIVDFVNDGGGLLIMGERLAAPNAYIQPIASKFGITLGLSDVVSSPPNIYELYTSELDLSHPVFSDFNTTDQIFLYAASELSVSESVTPISWQEGTGKIIAASTQDGQGRVVALGDSTLWSWVETYEERFYTADNPQFAVNTFNYLAVPEPATLLILGLSVAFFLRKRG